MTSDKKFLVFNKVLKVNPGNQRSVIQLPKEAPDTMNTVVVVEFNGEPIVKPKPTAGLQAIVSSQKSETLGAKNLLDGDRLTRWEAAGGERSASLEIDLKKPTTISTLILDEPWHPWDNRKQKLVLQYREGNEWKNALQTASNGIGLTEKFKPVRAQKFRLLIENKDAEPALSEWQLYGPE